MWAVRMLIAELEKNGEKWVFCVPCTYPVIRLHGINERIISFGKSVPSKL
jgi:hypothetical protein